MNLSPGHIFSFLLFVFGITVLSSCSKQEEDMYAFSGVVYNAKNEPVKGAEVEIYPTSNDWLTGHNMVVRLTTNEFGAYQSNKAYPAGTYYIFIEKIDSTNWNIREVEQGNYPSVTLPQNNSNMENVIDYSSMSVIANTKWILVNQMVEYSKPGNSVKEWQNVWSQTNNCMKDNAIIFDNTTKFLKSEGQYICKGEQQNERVQFTPPLFLSSLTCENLPNTGVLVKEMEYYDWPEFEQKDGHIYMACDRSIGQLFFYYLNDNNQRVLEVYSRN
jgi:hypothetical protein